MSNNLNNQQKAQTNARIMTQPNERPNERAITPPTNVNVVTSVQTKPKHRQADAYNTNNSTQSKHQNIYLQGIKNSNAASGNSLAPPTLTNSQIHGRKIDSPKIHVKEVQDNRPKTSAQHMRKGTINDSHLGVTLGQPVRMTKAKQKQGKLIQNKESKGRYSNNLQSASAKNTKNLIMTQIGSANSTAQPLNTNKEIDSRKFDFGLNVNTSGNTPQINLSLVSNLAGKYSKTPSVAGNNSKAQQAKARGSAPGLPPKTGGAKGQANTMIKTLQAPLKSALKGAAAKSSHNSQQSRGKRHSSTGQGQTILSNKTAPSSSLINTPQNNTSQVKKQGKITNEVAKKAIQGALKQVAGTRQSGVNQSSFGGLPTSTSRTGRSREHQNSIAATQQKRGRRTKSESRYSKNINFSKTNPKQIVPIKSGRDRRSGEIVQSPLSGSLLSGQSQLAALEIKRPQANKENMAARKQKKSRSPASGSHPELVKRQKPPKNLTLFNSSLSCGGNQGQTVLSQKQEVISISSMSSEDGEKMQNAQNSNKETSINRLFGKSYFVDGEQLLRRHMSPGTPTDQRSIDTDQHKPKKNRTSSATYRPQSTKSGVNKFKQKNQVVVQHQHSSEILGNAKISQSLEVDERSGDDNLLPHTQMSAPNASHLLSQQMSKKPNLNLDNCSKKNQSQSFNNLNSRLKEIQTSNTNTQKFKSSEMKIFDKMIKENIRKKTKQQDAENIKKFIKETKKEQRKQDLTQRNLQITKLNATHNFKQSIRGETQLERELSGERRSRVNQFNENKKSTSSGKVRSKSCIEKFFGGKSKSKPTEHIPDSNHESHQNVAVDGKRGRSIVLEIKELKREINEEIRQKTTKNRNKLDELNLDTAIQTNCSRVHPVSSVTNRKQISIGGLITSTAAVVEKKLIKKISDKTKPNNNGSNELLIDSGKIHKFIMKQKKQRFAKETKEKTQEQAKALRRKQNLIDLDAFTRGDKKKGTTAHLRNQSAQLNLKTGQQVKNLSTTLRKPNQILRNSDQPVKNFRTNRSLEKPIRELSYDNQDIDTVEKPNRSISKDRRSLGIDPCINITRKENMSGEKGRGITSSNKSKRHLSTSLSKQSPVRFGSSESRRKTNNIVGGPPPKVLPTRVINDPKRVSGISPGNHLRVRGPNRNVKPTLIGVSREEQGSPSPPQLRDLPGKYHPEQQPRYVSIENHDSEVQHKSETTQEFITIDPPQPVQKVLRVNHHQSLEQSPARLLTQQEEDERRNEFIEKYVVSPASRSGQRRESEAKSLIRLHSAAILIQSCVRKFLRKKNYFREQGLHLGNFEVEDMEGLHEGTTTSPKFNIPTLNLGIMSDNSKPTQLESDRQISTARSFNFARNTFQEFHKSLQPLTGNANLEFPEVLQLRAESIKAEQDKHTMKIKQKFKSKQISPRTYQNKKNEIEKWVKTEFKEIEQRKRQFELENDRSIKHSGKLVLEADINQQHIRNVFEGKQGGRPSQKQIHMEPQSSFRSGNLGQTSYREAPASARIIDMINSHRERDSQVVCGSEEGKVVGRQRTISEDISAPGPTISQQLSSSGNEEIIESVGAGHQNSSEDQEQSKLDRQLEIKTPDQVIPTEKRPQIQTAAEQLGVIHTVNYDKLNSGKSIPDNFNQNLIDSNSDDNGHYNTDDVKDSKVEHLICENSELDIQFAKNTDVLIDQLKNDMKDLEGKSPTSDSNIDLVSSSRFAPTSSQDPQSAQNKRTSPSLNIDAGAGHGPSIILEDTSKLATGDLKFNSSEKKESIQNSDFKSDSKDYNPERSVSDFPKHEMSQEQYDSKILTRNQNSTDLHIGISSGLDDSNSDLKIEGINPVSPANSDIITVTNKDEILKSLDETGRHVELHYPDHMMSSPDSLTAKQDLMADEIRRFGHNSQSPREQLKPQKNTSNIKIEIGGEDPGSSQNRNVQFADPAKVAISPMSDGSQMSVTGIICDSVSIGNSSNRDGDPVFGSDPTKVVYQEMPIEKEPHQPKTEENEVNPPFTKEPQKPTELTDDELTEIIKQKFPEQFQEFAEDFSGEVFDMLIAQMIYELDFIVNRGSNDKAKGLFKQNQGIKTDLFAIEKYIDEIQTEILQSDKKKEFLKAIGEPLQKSQVEMLAQMQDSKTGSFAHFIETFPQVLHLDLYLTLEKRRKEQREKEIQEEKKEAANQEVSSTFVAECEHIHNKVLFDCINDSLLQFKPYSKDGKPMPWSRVTKRLKPTDDFTIQEIFEIVKHDLFRAAITQAGLLPRREFIIKGVFDEEIFGEFREKKLVSLLAHEMIENESKWLNYEFEEAQVKIDIGDIILEQLVSETINLLGHNLGGKQNRVLK